MPAPAALTVPRATLHNRSRVLPSSGTEESGMEWMEWILAALQRGDGLPEVERADEHAEYRQALSQHDALVLLATAEPDEPNGWRKGLGTSIRTLSRITASPEGSCRLALTPVPADAPARRGVEGWPEACRGWMPEVLSHLRRFEVAELFVHVLAAEIRARLAGRQPGAVRQQDFHVVMLCLRPALWWEQAPRGYMKLVRQACRADEQVMPVAKNAILSALKAPARARAYQAPERTLEILEADAGDPDLSARIRMWRIEQASALEERSRRLAQVALRASSLTREVHEAARRVREGEPEGKPAACLEVVRGLLEVAELSREAGVAARDRGFGTHLEALSADPEGLRSQMGPIAEQAARLSTQMASDIRKAARELETSTPAPSARSRAGRFTPGVDRPHLPRLREHLRFTGRS